MAISFDYAPGATPLDPDEAAGLIPSHIVNHAQLNEWEMVNILEGGDVRQRYLDALRAADERDYGQLLAFVRS